MIVPPPTMTWDMHDVIRSVLFAPPKMFSIPTPLELLPNKRESPPYLLGSLMPCRQPKEGLNGVGYSWAVQNMAKNIPRIDLYVKVPGWYTTSYI